jgi:hypothetical protein
MLRKNMCINLSKFAFRLRVDAKYHLIELRISLLTEFGGWVMRVLWCLAGRSDCSQVTGVTVGGK